jgi:hypothetical protein
MTEWIRDYLSHTSLLFLLPGYLAPHTLWPECLPRRKPPMASVRPAVLHPQLGSWFCGSYMCHPRAAPSAQLQLPRDPRGYHLLLRVWHQLSIINRSKSSSMLQCECIHPSVLLTFAFWVEMSEQWENKKAETHPKWNFETKFQRMDVLTLIGILSLARLQLLMPVIPATQETDQEYRGSKPAQADRPYLKNTLHKKKGWWSDSRCRPWVQTPIPGEKNTQPKTGWWSGLAIVRPWVQTPELQTNKLCIKEWAPLLCSYGICGERRWS